MGGGIKGLEELQKRLQSLSNAAKDIEGQQLVPVTEMLTPSFLAGCSKFQSADDFFSASGFDIKSAEDFKAIPDAQWDTFVHANTTYRSWQEMMDAAVAAFVKKKLGF